MSVKSNSCFRNWPWCWDAVKSAALALQKGCIHGWLIAINQSECNIFSQNLSISNLNWFEHAWTSFWILVCLQTCECTVPMNWINTKVKPVVYMGLNQVKILQTCCFILTNQNDVFGQAKTISFLLFTSLNLDIYTCLSIQLKLMVHYYNSKILVFCGFSSQNWQNGSCKVGFDIPPLQALNLPALVQKLLPLRQRSTISVGFCTVLILHRQSSTSTVNDNSANLNEEMKLLFFEWYTV